MKMAAWRIDFPTQVTSLLAMATAASDGKQRKKTLSVASDMVEEEKGGLVRR
jgi:hypothetical protein